MTFLEKTLRTRVLKNFFKINLSSLEKKTAVESVKNKYSRATKQALIINIILLPAIIFLETSTIVSVLIPITMVAGTAWFSITLADIKKKFADFGLELTTELFASFTASLLALFLLATSSLFQAQLQIVRVQFTMPWIPVTAAALGSIVILWILYKIFVGAMKYDINDSMLAGQNEAAEIYYKKSLSLLQICANRLQEGKSLHVANYYIGVCFFEIFSFMRKFKVANGKITGMIEKANKLIKQPSMPQKEADKLSFELITTFIGYIDMTDTNEEIEKSIEAIEDEMGALKNNTNEDQAVIDTRMATIFQEIADMLEQKGETLFKKT